MSKIITQFPVGHGQVKHVFDESTGQTVPVVAIDSASAPGAAVATNGTPLPLASLAQTLSYNPDGTLSHVEVTHEGATYRQSMTWSAGRLAAVSAWEAQP